MDVSEQIMEYVSNAKRQASSGGSVILFLTRDGRLFLYQER